MATGQMYRLTVNVGGVNLGVFDGMSSGGGVTAAVGKYRPGGMGNEVTENAMPTYDDITATIGNQKSAYWTNTLKWLFSVAGTAQMSLNRQPLGADKKPLGDSITYRGTLSSATPGAVDPNDAATEIITLGMSVISAA